MRPMLIVNPAADLAFVKLAERTLDAVGSADAFQAALRATHPDAVVRPRELSGELLEIWYVYRDGHWTGPPAGDP